MMPISIFSRVKNPTVSDSSAIPPGTNNFTKLAQLASFAVMPSCTRLPIELIICTPWLTPIAKTKNGTKMDIGSKPNPMVCNIPNCQTTATNEHAIGNTVSNTERQNIQTIKLVIAIAIAKKTKTPFAPAATSPIIFAKPII